MSVAHALSSLFREHLLLLPDSLFLSCMAEIFLCVVFIIPGFAPVDVFPTFPLLSQV